MHARYLDWRDAQASWMASATDALTQGGWKALLRRLTRGRAHKVTPLDNVT
eukprot:CAMPEP_0206265776 /NCGR_PEP_ID=MMETSP0047_2-20121206/30198_1 /ASSEMBLY_ACC=CAM_ASM_000192 /TAXON_ID=195065 /ORGANISM="Chroomonas mesostigmatica_cf, Strain CCMP1168" /LENGTH=50 /DNA_ID=CAMNT_0053693739 /DNA_START=37 /DNA_END=185 /DNA_ORIENTATION=+